MKACVFVLSIYLFLNTFVSYSAVPKDNNILLNTSQIKLCWYEGKQYSQGAMIKQFDIFFVCSHRFDNQLNSELVWRKANKNGKPIKIDQGAKISVN